MLFNAEPIQSGLIDVSDQLPVDISVIIPLCNEEQNLRPLHEQITEVLAEIGRKYEIVFVNDGSTDGSAGILEELAQSDPRVIVIHLRRNFGKAIKLDASNWNQYAFKLEPSTIMSEEWALIVGAGDLEPELYHTPNDPGQEHNVFADNKSVARDLHGKYIDLLKSLGTKEEYIGYRSKPLP